MHKEESIVQTLLDTIKQISQFGRARTEGVMEKNDHWKKFEGKLAV